MEVLSNGKEKVPIVEGLFTWPSDEPKLIGSECPSCGDVQFPESNVCGNPDCDHEKPPERVFLSKTGKLYSYTIHHTNLREPFSFHEVPFTIGAVELPEGINLVSKIDAKDKEELEIGMRVRFKVKELYEDDEKIYMTYYFEPGE